MSLLQVGQVSGVAGGLDEVSGDGAAVEEVGTVADAADVDTSSWGMEEGVTAGGDSRASALSSSIERRKKMMKQIYGILDS